MRGPPSSTHLPNTADDTPRKKIASEKIQPDIASFPLEKGDWLILCTDGLTRYLEDEELLDIIAGHKPAEVCSILIDLANSRGGRDNVTVVAAHF